MTELQLSLILLGVLLIIGVIIFNWLQESRYDRDNKFNEQSTDDVLFQNIKSDQLEEKSADDIYNSPNENAEDLNENPRNDTKKNITLNQSDLLADKLEFLLELSVVSDVDSEKLQNSLDLTAQLADKVKMYHFDENSGHWASSINSIDSIKKVRFGIPLFDKRGRLERDDLLDFVEIVERNQASLFSEGNMSPIEKSLEQAIDLQEFCREVGSIVGINIIANKGHLFSGVKIHALCEKYGLRLHDQGGFLFEDSQNQLLFSLDSSGAESLKSETMRKLMVPGITFLVDVPMVSDGLKVFDRVIELARIFAEDLNGNVVDDNRRPLVASACVKIRDNLKDVYKKMNDYGVPPGSETARRIFY